MSSVGSSGLGEGVCLSPSACMCEIGIAASHDPRASLNSFG